MNELTLKQLRYFQSLARWAHFGRAAEACEVSQPALSQQIKDLERILGAALVERGARQTHLTSLGAELAVRARDILRAVDELAQLARSVTETLSGKLRLGAIPTVAPYLLPALIQSIRQHYPKLELRPREAVTQKLLSDLLEARLDLAILALPTSESWLSEIPLVKEEFVLVRPLDEASKPVPRTSELRELELLLLEEGHCLRDQALSVCQISSSSPRDLMEGSSLSTLVQMVGAGIGITLIPEMAVAVETSSAPVAIARLPQPRPYRTIGMVWRKSNPIADKLTQMARLLQMPSSSLSGP